MTKYAIIFTILIGFVPEPTTSPLTLQQVCTLYRAGLYDMRDFAIFANTYKASEPAWGCEINRWIMQPFRDVSRNYKHMHGPGYRTRIVTTETVWGHGRWEFVSQHTTVSFRFEFDTIKIVPLSIVVVDPNNIIEPIASSDPNALVLHIEEIIFADPNNAELWQRLLKLVKGGD